MDFNDIDLDSLIPDLEKKRKGLGLSYQNIADSCNVSQTTIIRLFKRDGDPSFSTLQKVVATLQYEFVQAPIAPTNATPEQYTQYLIDCIAFERKDKKVRLEQQEARHNRRQNETKREKLAWMGLSIALGSIFVILFIYDFAHLDRGWIQAVQGGYKTAAFEALLSVKDWFERLWL